MSYETRYHRWAKDRRDCLPRPVARIDGIVRKTDARTLDGFRAKFWFR